MEAFTGVNLFTLSRAFLALPIIFCILNNYYYIAVSLIMLAILTDFFDGMIARKFNSISKSGELLDPAVDKIFVISVLVAFVEKHYINTYYIYLIILREMLITWFRSINITKNKVIPASSEGKIKTTLQFGAIMLMAIPYQLSIEVGRALLIISIVVAYYSGFRYFYLVKIKN